MATPLHALVPYGSSREPGLILVTPGGHVRFWDSLGIGLAGGEHYTTITLDLVEDERVTTLTRADVSLGCLFRNRYSAEQHDRHKRTLYQHRPADSSVSL